MQSSDTLLVFLRQKLTEQTSSTFRLFQAVDMDGDGYVSVHDFIQYCDRFSLPRGVVTEEQVSSWFNRYVDCNESGCIVNSRRRNMMDYNLFKHFLEDSIESVVVSQEDKTAVTVDTVRRALVRYMHSLGCSVYKFYKVCTHGAEFLYEHHLRNILSTRCGIMLSNSAWSNLWKQLKSDPRIQHMSIHEFKVLLQHQPELPLESSNTSVAAEETITFDESASDMKIKFREEGVHDETEHRLAYNTELDGNVSLVMLYLAERFTAISSPRALFGRIDRRRYNYLTIADFVSAVRDLTDIEVSEELTRDIFRVVSERANDGSTHQLISYQGFLKLLSCQEYLVPLQLPNRPCSTAAMYCKRPLIPVVECALKPPQHGRRATISVPTGEVDMKASFTGAYSPNYMNVPHNSSHQAFSADKALPKQCVRPASTSSVAKSSCSLLCLQTGDDQRYTTTALNSLPLSSFSDKQCNKDNGFITTEAQMEIQAQHTECSVFVQDVIKKLRARGESMRVLLSEAFHNRKIVSSKELLWFFRSRLGIAVSPLIILQTFKLGGNDTIQIESVLNVFKLRPGSAAQPQSRPRARGSCVRA